MAKQKWYVVWRGKQPGVYTTWDQTKEQVHGFGGAKYQSFKTQAGAEMAFKEGPEAFQDLDKKMKGAAVPFDRSGIIGNSLAVDAACSGNPGVVEYQGVYTDTGTDVFHKKVDGLGTNNCGEFLAIVHALEWMETHKTPLPIYSDSDVALLWVKKKQYKTTLERTAKTKPLFLLLDHAVTWLNNHPVTVDLLKWNTKQWGEIPADFGRK
jgi:ribonuclease HI